MCRYVVIVYFGYIVTFQKSENCKVFINNTNEQIHPPIVYVTSILDVEAYKRIIDLTYELWIIIYYISCNVKLQIISKLYNVGDMIKVTICLCHYTLMLIVTLRFVMYAVGAEYETLSLHTKTISKAHKLIYMQ